MLHAQKEPLFEFLDQESKQLSEHGAILAARFANPEKNPTVKNSWPIRFQNFETKKELNFLIRLPEVETSLQLKSATYFSQDVIELDRTYTYDVWSGSIIDDNKEGTFMLIRSREGMMGGHLNYNNKYYKIQSLDINDALLLEKQTNTAAYKCGLEDETSAFSETINSSSGNLPFCDPPPSPKDCRKQWVFLRVDTQELRDSLWNVYYTQIGIYWIADYAVSLDLVQGILNFTQMLTNNNLPTDKITWYGQRIPTGGIPYTQYSDDDLDQFKSYVTQNFSSLYNQNVAILQSHHVWTENGGIPTYGVVDFIPTRNTGYLSGKNYALSYFPTEGYPWFVFSHEMGHALGARHDNDFGIFGQGICGKGINLGIPDSVDRTVMAVMTPAEASQGKGKFHYLSDPNVVINGYTLGTPSQNNKIVVHNVLCGNVATGSPKPALDISRTPVQTKQTIVFPNPTNGNFLLPVKPGKQSVTIFDNTGKVIQTQNLDSGQTQLRVDISSQSNGLYFIRIDQGQATKTIKILKNE